MAISDDLREQVRTTFKAQWTLRDGTTIPSQDSIKLSNDGVQLDSVTILYADLAESTGMVDKQQAIFAAEVYKNYLYCAAKLIRHFSGTIMAYDGDRIMGVYHGGNKNTDAVKTALAINWAVTQMIPPELKAVWNTDFVLRHTIGIDTSKALVARTGVRGDNDLVWVGRAANWAAKLCSLSNATPLWITEEVYEMMNASVKIYTDGRVMWEKKLWTDMNKHPVYCSTWWVRP